MFVKNKFVIACFVSLVLIISFSSCAKTVDQDSFRFVFITDIHVQDENLGEPGFRMAINKINELKPEFVLTGGDMIMDALGQNYDEAIRQYTLYEDIIKDFEMPIHHTIGNHESFGLYVSSGISPDHPEYGKEMYKKRLGDRRTYNSFDHKNWHFIVLDDIGFTPGRRYYGNVDSLQIEWLKKDLGKIDKNTPIAISVHIPFVSVTHQIYEGGTASASSSIAVWNSNEVLELFAEHNLKLVLQGHLHIVEEMIVNDITFITGGAVCGDKWKGPKLGFPEGFVVVKVDGNNFSWKYETYGWTTSFSK